MSEPLSNEPPWPSNVVLRAAEHGALLDRLNKLERRLAETPRWRPVSELPEGAERPVLLWIDVRRHGLRDTPYAKAGWWRHGPGVFAVGNIEDASNLVTHWMEITNPNETAP